MEATVKNVIVVVADSLSGGHTNMRGYKRDTTPFIHSYFAEHGLIYTNARSNASWTLPSFNSFLRSRLPSDVKVAELLTDTGTLPKILGDNGIDVVGFLKEPTFSILESIYNTFKNQEAHALPFEDHEILFSEALAWIKKRDAESRPSFLLIHDNTVHNPYVPPAPYRTLFDAEGNEVDCGPIANRTYLQGLCGHEVPDDEKERLQLLYDQKIRYLDDLMKRFIGGIPEQFLKETAIIFTADHGDEFGNHHNIFNHGYSLYDELLRVPLCMRVPGTAPATIDTPVSLLDLAPTVLSIFGIERPLAYKGHDLPHSDGENVESRAIQIEGNRVIPFNVREKLAGIDTYALEQKLLEMPEEVAIVQNGWKYYVSRTRGEELYHVSEDQEEKNDLIGKISGQSAEDRTFIEGLRTAMQKTQIPLRYLRQVSPSIHDSVIRQHHANARFEYRLLVNQHLRDTVFQHKIVTLIEKYPFFLPPYLEILEHLEGKRDVPGYSRFLSYTYARLKTYFTDGRLLERIAQNFNYEELLTLKYLLEKLERTGKLGFVERLRLVRAKEIVLRFSAGVFPKKSKRHLVPVREHVEVGAFVQELRDKEHFWYGSTERQKRLYYHKHTQSIMLRRVETSSEIPVQVDGQHESVRTIAAPYFLHTIRFVENFAYEMNCGLGRVALIRLEPKKLAYRHTDTEIWLRGRTRYHLVIDAKPGNILFSGDEILEVENGQLLKYENKVMHKSYNESNAWRTHLVFDMFPLPAKENEE